MASRKAEHVGVPGRIDPAVDGDRHGDRLSRLRGVVLLQFQSLTVASHGDPDRVEGRTPGRPDRQVPKAVFSGWPIPAEPNPGLISQIEAFQPRFHLFAPTPACGEQLGHIGNGPHGEAVETPGAASACEIGDADRVAARSGKPQSQHGVEVSRRGVVAAGQDASLRSREGKGAIQPGTQGVGLELKHQLLAPAPFQLEIVLLSPFGDDAVHRHGQSHRLGSGEGAVAGGFADFGESPDGEGNPVAGTVPGLDSESVDCGRRCLVNVDFQTQPRQRGLEPAVGTVPFLADGRRYLRRIEN